MDSVQLDTLIPELLVYLCWFLSEADIISLSQTCARLRGVLNDNTVWKRLVTEEAKYLKTQKQQLEPPFFPDPNFCENRQHLMRKNHLLSNWRKGNCLRLSVDCEHIIDLRFNWFINLFYAESYKDHYLFIEFDEDCHHYQQVFWDISGTPVPHGGLDFIRGKPLLVGDILVETASCKVKVYQVNIKDKSYPLLYSFVIFKDNVLDDSLSSGGRDHKCSLDLCDRVVSKGEIYVVFSEESTEPVCHKLHIWDIVNAKKVGVFESPVACLHVKVHSFVNNVLILAAEGKQENVYFKFDISTKTFSIANLKVKHIESVLFYEHYYVKMENHGIASERSVICKSLEFDSGTQIAERCFGRADCKLQRKCIVNGKLVILSSDSFHVVDAVTLVTLSVVPHEPDVSKIIGLTSVFGRMFVVTVGEGGGVKVWDIEKKITVPIPYERLSDLTMLELKLDRKELCIFNVNYPRTKFVIVEEQKITVTHFW